MIEELGKMLEALNARVRPLGAKDDAEPVR
jgi:hypothetical protein